MFGVERNRKAYVLGGVALLLLSAVIIFSLACGGGAGGDLWNSSTENHKPKVYTPITTTDPASEMVVIETQALEAPVYNNYYETTLVASGGTPPYTWYILEGNLPMGLALDQHRGIISGIPMEDAVSRKITIAVSDQKDKLSTIQYTLTLGRAPIPLKIESLIMPEGYLNESYSSYVTGSGGTPPYTWEIVSGTFHTGLDFNAATGLLSGTPTEIGPHTVTMALKDSAGTEISAMISLNVGIAPLTITTSSLPDGAKDFAYTYTATAMGGVVPYTWSIGAGNLPGGLLLGADGVISGTPTAIETTSVTLQVIDSIGTITTKQLSFEITGLAITTDSTLPGGTVDELYTVALTSSGAPGSRTWSIASGALPDDVVLNAGTGIINGTPYVSGTYTFTVEVTNGVSTASRDFTMNVVGNFWKPTSTGANCPTPRRSFGVVSTGNYGVPEVSNKVFIWGGYNGAGMNTGGIYDTATDTWTATSTAGACPSARWGHSTTWTGNTGVGATSYKIIIWGGYDGAVGLNTGSIFDLATQTWTPMSILGDCPTLRWAHSAFWVGNTGDPLTSYKFFVWGGWSGAATLNTGSIYDIVSDTWTAISTAAPCPTARIYCGVINTGNTGTAIANKLIFWGGTNNAGTYYNTGGIFDLSTKSWTATSTVAPCPSARYGMTFYWTGNTSNSPTDYKVFVWGGRDNVGALNTGGIYDISSNSWAPVSSVNAPAARVSFVGRWWGTSSNAAISRKVMVWGGYDGNATYYDTGGIYDLDTNTWTATSTGANCPSVRYGSSFIWTGSKMLIWGGWNGANVLNTGGLYDIATNTWAATSIANCPEARTAFTAPWWGNTGNNNTSYRLMIWGGWDNVATHYNTGGIYTP